MTIKSRRIIAIISILAIQTATMGNAFAQKIGEITVQDTTGNTTITTPVNIEWDGTFGGTANGTGSLTGVKVTATVNPIINMKISHALINLGVISGLTGSGSVKIEVGSNSPTGVTVKAKSEKGGLEHTTVSSSIVNNNTTGGSYTFSAVNGGTAPGSATFPNSTPVQINTANQEINIYSNTSAEDLEASTYDIEFKVTALAQTSAVAGAYEDFVSFTVISNF